MDIDNDLGTITRNIAGDALIIGGDSGFVVPSGPTETRSLIPLNGEIRFNTTTNQIEFYQPAGWANLGGHGLPIGGTASQVLIKNSSTDYDSYWGTITADMAPYAKQLVAFVKNDTASTIPKGTPVYQTGNAGSSWTILVRPADAADPLKMPAIGVLGEDLAPAATGNMIILGEIRDVNTSAFTEGDLVYVAPGGGYTNVKPTNINYAVQFLGIVSKIHATNGGGYITGTGTLDTFRKAVATGYEGWNGSNWEAISAGSGTGTVTSVAITGTGITVTGSPITTSGTIGLSLSTVGTAGSYRNVTTDAYGRVTAGNNNFDAFNDLTDVTITTPQTGEVPYYNGTDWVNNLPKNFISLNDLLGITVNNPQLGESLYFNGTNWINYGLPGGVNGGGAAKRIWSNNVAAQSGTTRITPGLTPPLITDGTQVWSVTLTPYSSLASYVVQSNIGMAGSVNNENLILALFRTVAGISTYLGGTIQIVSSGGNSATLSFSITDSPATTNPVTYSVRVGSNTGTWYVNRRSSEVTFSGTQTGWVMWEY